MKNKYISTYGIYTLFILYAIYSKTPVDKIILLTLMSLFHIVAVFAQDMYENSRRSEAYRFHKEQEKRKEEIKRFEKYQEILNSKFLAETIRGFKDPTKND